MTEHAQPAEIRQHLRFTPAPQDLVAAYQRHAYGRLWNRATLISLGFSLLVVTALVMFFMPEAPWQAIVAVCAGSLFGGALVPMAMIRWRVPAVACRIYRQQKALHEEIELTWDAVGLEATAANGHSRSAWKDFHRWREDDAVILIYYSEALFQFLPKRVLTDAQIDDLRSLAAGAEVVGARA